MIELTRSGDVLLFEGRGWVSRLIRWWTRSTFSHAAMVVEIGLLGDRPIRAVCEATSIWGVRLTPLSRYLEHCRRNGCRVHWYRVQDGLGVEPHQAARYALAQWGKRYASYRQLLISFGRLTGWIRRLRGKRVVDLDRQRFFCSELVADALKVAGYRPPKGDHDLPAAIDPGAVSRFTCLRRLGML